MTIVNLILIVLVLGVAVSMIYVHINAQKNAEVVTKIDVDDQTYTLDKMIEFVKRRLDEITKINLYDIGLSEEELKRRKSKKNPSALILQQMDFFMLFLQTVS